MMSEEVKVEKPVTLSIESFVRVMVKVATESSRIPSGYTNSLYLYVTNKYKHEGTKEEVITRFNCVMDTLWK